MFDNFTDSTKEIVYNAQNMAIENHNTMIEPIHILASIAQGETAPAADILSELKLNSAIFQSDIKNALNNLAKTAEITNQVYFSKQSLKLFEDASEYAKKLKDKFISIEHILLCLSSVEDSDIKRLVEKYNLTEAQILNAMKKIICDKK
ncbi:hypothetical protein IJ670_03775, partial [bacterium]|nr:hypothetical protein [bacterium]